MELIKGITLDELIAKRGAMPANLFAPLFARLCEVVHTAQDGRGVCRGDPARVRNHRRGSGTDLRSDCT